MKIRYVIQARMGSTRLPGKILMKIGDQPLIGHIIDRLVKSGADLNDIIFVLSHENNIEVEKFLQAKNISFITGDLYNVLSRYIEASKEMDDSDLVVRLTGDNPFVDFKSLNTVLKQVVNDPDIDYAYPNKLPLGMGFEIIRKRCLFNQLTHHLKPHHLEHVTMFIRENPHLYKIVPVQFYTGIPRIRLTVDYQEDLEMVRATWDFFNKKNNPYFCSGEIIELSKNNPSFFRLNREMEQKLPTEYEKQ